MSIPAVAAPVAETPGASSVYWYHPELDILRFCAFALVFVFHAIRGQLFVTGFPAGAYGVDLFFTLSAYLITEILLREQRRFGRFDLGAFYLRRLLRIWPLYFAFLLFAFFVEPWLLPPDRFTWRTRLMYLLFVGNWQFLLGGERALSVASLLWSVCLEEQFYLTWPLLLRRWMKQIPLIAGALFAVSTLWLTILALRGPFAYPIDIYWKATFSHLDSLAVGALLAFFLKGKALPLTLAARLALGVTGALGLWLAGFAGPPWGFRALLTYPLAALACGTILVSVLRPMRADPPGWLARVFVRLGRRSYGLYVFHGLCQTVCFHHLPAVKGHWVQAILAFLFTVLLAECSYAILEMPFLKLKQRFSAIRSSPAPSTAV